MAFVGVTELRNLPQLIYDEELPVSVTADTEIVELSGSVDNSLITTLTIQCTMEDAGKYYLLDENGYKHYLTDPNKDYPAKLQLLSTYFLKKNKVVSLCFSVNSTMTDLIIGTGAGVY